MSPAVTITRRTLRRLRGVVIAVLVFATMSVAPVASAAASPLDDVLGALDLGSSSVAPGVGSPPATGSPVEHTLTIRYTGAATDISYATFNVRASSCLRPVSPDYATQENEFPQTRTAAIVFRVVRSGGCTKGYVLFQLILKAGNQRLTGNFRLEVTDSATAPAPKVTCSSDPDWERGNTPMACAATPDTVTYS
ncbi:hypothetical protein [Williamsia deligens]|uniref:Uncharacterized protein n=1 Tax=Williamsia deligens TaxID=321325 RepID=A0ABW3G5M9_9NOCA|nr:hypothetical protein [Williamsia deligens]